MAKQLDSWSYSRYALYETCPLKLKLSAIDKIKEPTSPAMARGNKIHKGIAEYVTAASDALPQEAMQHPFPLKLIREVREQPDKVIEQQWGYTSRWAPTGWFGKDTWFRATLDAAVLYEDMHADVVDWKSGKQYETNTDQMELNAVALMCHFKPTLSVTTRMVYLDTGNETTAEYTRQQLPDLKAKWEAKIAPMFADTAFLPRPNDKCKFCDYAKSKQGLCRFG